MTIETDVLAEVGATFTLEQYGIELIGDFDNNGNPGCDNDHSDFSWSSDEVGMQTVPPTLNVPPKKIGWKFKRGVDTTGEILPKERAVLPVFSIVDDKVLIRGVESPTLTRLRAEAMK